MKQELWVICDSCKAKQVYHGQYYCDLCHKGMSMWSVANQVLAQREKKNDLATKK